MIRVSLFLWAAFLASAIVTTLAQPQLSRVFFDSVDVSSTIEAGSGNVIIADSTGKIPNAALTGTWTNVAYSAGNYFGNGTLTWTVASGDVISNTYVEFGKTMLWAAQVITTSVSGTGTELRLTVPNGRTLGGTTSGPCAALDDTTVVNAIYLADIGNTYVRIVRDSNAGNWTASSNVTQLRCTFTLIVS